MAEIDRHLFIILGGTGDLAQRKLFPALTRLITHKGATDHCTVLGVGTEAQSEDAYRKWVRDGLADAGISVTEIGGWVEANVHYATVDADPDAYVRLRARIEEVEREAKLEGNRIFYLALPPAVFPVAVTRLGELGLNDGPGWTRLVVEKPFGTDLETARNLNETLHQHFDESQVYRIDHYLGKETVQNLLSFRFANPMFEAAWNRSHVERVEITVAEDLGIGSRAAYYEQAGVLRDMVQNHLTQLLALVAMEPPNAFEADKIRNEKVKVVESIAPIDPSNVVFGQYDAGWIADTPVRGYREEEGVDPDSETPTFAGIKLFVDSWRWQGVPFYLRTGKRLPARVTHIAVRYHTPHLCIFHGVQDACGIDSNVLLITLQPDESFAVTFNVKSPERDDVLDPQNLHFSYAHTYGALPDAYQTLILDVIEGDQTLFVRADEVEASWRVYTPLLGSPRELYRYDAGTWGPAAMDRRLALADADWTQR